MVIGYAMSKLIHNQYTRIVFLVFFAVAIFSSAACRRKRVVSPPDTYPVSGKLVSASGKIPVGYRLVFEPDDPESSASGVIKTDGSFTLETRYMGVKCDGAAAGECSVIIVPPMSMAGASEIVLPKKINIEPRANQLTIPIP